MNTNNHPSVYMANATKKWESGKLKKPRGKLDGPSSTADSYGEIKAEVCTCSYGIFLKITVIRYKDIDVPVKYECPM